MVSQCMIVVCSGVTPYAGGQPTPQFSFDVVLQCRRETVTCLGEADAGPSPHGTMTMTLTFALRRSGGRKEVGTPDCNSAWVPRPPQVDSTLVTALARAFPLAQADRNRGVCLVCRDLRRGEDQRLLC